MLDIIAVVISSVLMARIHMTWTHITISTPSTKRWYQRIPAMSTMRHVWIPAAVCALAQQSSIYVTVLSAEFFLSDSDPVEIYGNYSHKTGCAVALKFLAIVAVAILTFLFIVLPATTTLARVEASLLPESDDTIVPFDRSFGGKVVPAVVGGTGVISFLDAWRSFNWEARRRLVKLDVKIFFIELAIMFVFIHVFFFEIYAIMGDSLKTLVLAGKAQLDMQAQELRI